jgi:hypothetical protein
MPLVTKSSVVCGLLVLCGALLVSGCDKGSNTKKTADQPLPNTTDTK